MLRHARQPGWYACGVLLLLIFRGVDAAEGSSVDAELMQYATCAAYYFNATNVRPMGDYEALYVAGETAFNEAMKRVDRKTVDDLVARASAEMKQLIGENWQNFHRADHRHGATCAALTGYAGSAPAP